MNEEPIRVLLVDDHAMVREGLAALLSKHPQINIVGQLGDGLSVVDSVYELHPDVVILDISMPGLNGLDVCRNLTRKFSKVAVLILTMHEDEQFVARALEYGASGYITKEAAADELPKAVETVARGEVYFSPGIPISVLRHIANQAEEPYESLTSRERQVFQLVVEGKTNREVSEMLNLSIKTIDSHRAHLMRKLDIHDQTALVKYAILRGIISIR